MSPIHSLWKKWFLALIIVACLVVCTFSVASTVAFVPGTVSIRVVSSHMGTHDQLAHKPHDGSFGFH